MMSTHIIEIFDCLLCVPRGKIRAELETLGVSVVDEKIVEKTNSVKFYVNLKQLDYKTEEQMFLGLKNSGVLTGKDPVVKRVTRGSFP